MDIVERLREKRGVLDNRWPGPSSLDLEAADEIERLRKAYRESQQMLMKAIRGANERDGRTNGKGDLRRAWLSEAVPPDQSSLPGQVRKGSKRSS